MKWFKKAQDLYELLLLEDLYFGNTGSFARRVPGGWVFYLKQEMWNVAHNRSKGPSVTIGSNGALKRTIIGTFVPFSDEFLYLSNENIENLAEHSQSMDTKDLPAGTDPNPGKIGHQSGPDGDSQAKNGK